MVNYIDDNFESFNVYKQLNVVINLIFRLFDFEFDGFIMSELFFFKFYLYLLNFNKIKIYILNFKFLWINLEFFEERFSFLDREKFVEYVFFNN